MKDSLAITAQAIPFLNDFKNFTYLCINITYCKDNTFWTYCKKNGRTSQRIRLQKISVKFSQILKALKDIIHRFNQRIKVCSPPSTNFVEFGKMN